MGNRKRVVISELQPGMVLSNGASINSYHVGSDNLLISEGSVVTPRIIELLQNHGISHVYIKTNEEVGDETLNAKELKKLSEIYDGHVEEVSSVLHVISEGGNVNIYELNDLTDDIIGQLSCKSAIFSHLNALKTAEEPTFTHSSNVSLLCRVFGEWLGLSKDDLVNLTGAALLHDIGKIAIPDEILNKPGKLTDSEFKIMKTHTVQGYEMLKGQDIPEDIKLAALLHHEKLDGSGYPLGLAGNKINRLARMITVCDIYDAMTTNRVYRKAVCPFDVIETFERRSYGELDTEYLLIFLKNIAYSYLNRNVLLSNGDIAEIVFVNDAQLTRPIVKMLDGTLVDLSHRHELRIIELV